MLDQLLDGMDEPCLERQIIELIRLIKWAHKCMVSGASDDTIEHLHDLCINGL